ncbi:MAG: hypothetical protein H6807_00430 [Planctomycetes bacterium]|nr:hypothetical protein [Planctomycetota bacterium]
MSAFLVVQALVLGGGLLIAATAYAQPGARFWVTLRAALPFAPGLGFGLLSALWFLGLDLAQSPPRGLFVLGSFFLVAGLATLPKREFPPDPGSPRASGTALAARAIFFATLLFGLWCFLDAVRARPGGGFDSMAIWNYAARFLARAGADYRGLILELDPAHHMDYPLLMSATTAAFWTLAGQEGHGAQHLIQASFVVGLPLLMRRLLRGFVGTIRADLGGALVATLPQVLIWSSRQYADLALAYFILAGAGGLASRLSARAVERPPLLLTGFMLAAAIWTKNEGQPLVIILLLGFILLRFRDGPALRVGKELVRLFLGALPILAAFVLFKLGWAPRNDLMAGIEGKFAESISRPDRWHKVAEAFGAEAWPFTPGPSAEDPWPSFRRWGGFWPLIGILATVGLAYRRLRLERHEIFLWLVSFGGAAGWFMVYVLTPNDQDWHLATSLNRLLLQIAPTILFTMLVTVSPRRELEAGAEAPVQEVGPT